MESDDVNNLVRLRDIEQEVLPRLYEFHLDPDANRLAMTIRRNLDAFVARVTDTNAIVKAILVGNSLAGSIACFKNDGFDNVGYWLGKEFWGKGIASGALDLLLKEIHSRPLYARVATGNRASLRVLQKSGFVVERVHASPANDRFLECEEATLRGEIVISSWGTGRKELLTRLRAAFGELHASEHGIEEAKSIDGIHWIDSQAGEVLKSIHEVFPAPGRSGDKERFGDLFGDTPQAWLSKLREIEMGEETSKTPAIYISYAWGDSDETGPESRVDIVDRLYESLKNDGVDVRRDKHNVQYKGDLIEFMREIGRAPCVVAVVSDKSLRSPWCMYELFETHRNLQFRDRIFPIVLSDAKIHRLTDRLGYIAHWKKEYKDLEARVNEVKIDVLRSTGSFQEYERIRDIAQGADELLTILGTMNTSKPIDLEANNFELLKQSIIEWFEKLGGKRQ